MRDGAAGPGRWRRLRRGVRVVGRSVGPAIGLTLPRLLRSPVWSSATADAGGVGVIVAPGFAGTDASMAVLRAWFRRLGYRPIGADLRWNVGCSTELVDRLERRVEAHVAATGGPVVLLGHSRGGWLCRLVAVRRPELVRGLIMLGSPVLDPLDAQGWVMLALRMVVGLSDRGVRGLLGSDCLSGACREVTERGPGRRADRPGAGHLLARRRRGRLAVLPGPGGRVGGGAQQPPRAGHRPGGLPGDGRPPAALGRRPLRRTRAGVADRARVSACRAPGTPRRAGRRASPRRSPAAGSTRASACPGPCARSG